MWSGSPAAPSPPHAECRPLFACRETAGDVRKNAGRKKRVGEWAHESVHRDGTRQKAGTADNTFPWRSIPVVTATSIRASSQLIVGSWWWACGDFTSCPCLEPPEELQKVDLVTSQDHFIPSRALIVASPVHYGCYGRGIEMSSTSGTTQCATTT